MAIRWVTSAASTGNLTGVAAGTTTGGPALRTNLVEPGTLSCLLAIDAETDAITVAPKWQVSQDNSTWKNLTDTTAALPAGWATGTTGADASVERVIACPVQASGWKFVRAAIVSGGATGGTADTYSFTYQYRAERYPQGE